MAHEFESGFFTEKPAWHDLGDVFKRALTLEEATAHPSMNWRVLERPVYTREGPCEGFKALVRSTDNRVLHVAREGYEVFQNADGIRFLAPFFQDGACSMESGGSLKGGRRMWVLAKIRDTAADILPGDACNAYLLMSWAHDGSAAVSVLFTPVRVVCWNTLSAALGAKTNVVRLRHTKGLPEALTTVQQSIDVSRRTFAISVEGFRAMARRPISAAELKGFILRTFEVPDVTTLDASGKIEEPTPPRAAEKIVELFERDRLAGRTAWGAYNAVTHWIDHERGRSAETRLDASWFGPGADLRTRAHKEALAMVGN